MTLTKEQLNALADLVDKAHDILLEDGWAGGGQGFVPGTGRCMESAVNKANNCPAYNVRTFSTLSIAELGFEEYQKLRDLGIDYIWNDAKDRTEDEVFDRMREVSKALREEAGQL